MPPSIKIRVQLASAELAECLILTGIPARKQLHKIRRELSQAIANFEQQLLHEKLLEVVKVNSKSKKTGKLVEKEVLRPVKKAA